jgi:hypothetical protein
VIHQITGYFDIKAFAINRPLQWPLKSREVHVATPMVGTKVSKFVLQFCHQFSRSPKLSSRDANLWLVEDLRKPPRRLQLRVHPEFELALAVDQASKGNQNEKTGVRRKENRLFCFRLFFDILLILCDFQYRSVNRLLQRRVLLRHDIRRKIHHSTSGRARPSQMLKGAIRILRID